MPAPVPAPVAAPVPAPVAALTLREHLDLMHEAGYDVSGLRQPWIDTNGRAHANRCPLTVRRHAQDAPHVQLDFCFACHNDESVGAYWTGLERRILNALQVELRIRETLDLVEGILDPSRTTFYPDGIGYAFASYRELLEHLHPNGARTSVTDTMTAAAAGAATWTALHADLTGTHKPADLYVLDFITRVAARWEALQDTRPAHRMFTAHRHYLQSTPAVPEIAQGTATDSARSPATVLYLMNPAVYVNACAPYDGPQTARDVDVVVCLAWERDELGSWTDNAGDIHVLIDYDPTLPRIAQNNGAVTAAVLAGPASRDACVRAFEMTLGARSDDLDIPVADIFAGVLAAHA